VAPCPVGGALARLTDRGQAEDSRARNGNRISAKQLAVVLVERFAQASKEATIPLAVAEAVAEQHPDRRRALGREVGQGDRDELFSDTFGRIFGAVVNPLRNHVVGQHQPPKQRRVIVQAARLWRPSQRTKRRDEVEFAGHRWPVVTPARPSRRRRAGR
jgi:hypothetical protein